MGHLLSALMTSFLAAGNSAVIVDSGSTNTAGFRITVDRNGSAEFTATPRRNDQNSKGGAAPKTRQVPANLVQRLYSDLDSAKPMAELPKGTCMKSASFGTTLTIEYNGESSPDLSCGAHENAKVQALIADANDIMALFTEK